jgi:NADH-quinone oxidoreductase subunit J
VTIYGGIYYVLAFVIVVATALAVTRRQPVHAVLYLIVAFLGAAALFFLLGAPLLAVFMIMIYAGAIMVLFLFVIMLLRQAPGELGSLPQWGPAALLGLIFLSATVAMVLGDPGSGFTLQVAAVQPKDFGRFLFERYWLAVEIVSLLLLVALVAAVQVGRGRSAGGDKDQ